MFLEKKHIFVIYAVNTPRILQTPLFDCFTELSAKLFKQSDEREKINFSFPKKIE